jgi:hypothetical protein
MIVVEIKLVSGICSSRDQELGTLVLDNVTSVDDLLQHNNRKGDYRARMYKKGALTKVAGCARRMVRTFVPTREGRINGHNRLAEPVQNLVAKALKELGYK